MSRPKDFETILRGTGHLYCEAPECDLPRVRDRVRHIVKIHLPTGEIRPICGQALGDNDQQLCCPGLERDSNCPACIDACGIVDESLTKRSLMLDQVHCLINFEQIFLDVMYWNFHNPDETPINPDPAGELAAAWENRADQIIQMIERCRPMMSRHANRFGWAEEISESG